MLSIITTNDLHDQHEQLDQHLDNINQHFCPDTLLSDVDTRKIIRPAFILHNRLQVQLIYTISSTVEHKLLQNLGSVNEQDK